MCSSIMKELYPGICVCLITNTFIKNKVKIFKYHPLITPIKKRYLNKYLVAYINTHKENPLKTHKEYTHNNTHKENTHNNIFYRCLL